MFLDPVVTRYRAEAEIVGLCDLSRERVSYHQRRLKELGYHDVPIYLAHEFDRMLQETQPDEIVVCTIDREHARYIAASLHAGCNVVTEKPMAIDAEGCQTVLNAVQATGRHVRVAFNCRWAPGAAKVRELLAAQTVGRIWQVNMEYLLNTSHGADYFRRWHATKQNSGGLLVHKATHHFDLINWWLDGIPEWVVAQGRLAFYGRTNALRRGDEMLTRYPRYRGLAPASDPFAYNYRCPLLQDQQYEEALYVGAEAETGYVRDQNVFREGIDIEDVMNVLVRYRDGCLLNYSLNAFSPYEGYRVSFTGERGRIEYEERHGTHLLGETSPSTAPAEIHRTLRVCPHFQPPYAVEIPVVPGGHGGGDPLLQEQIFALRPPHDTWRRAAGHEQGAASALIGAAANQSLAKDAPVKIEQLLKLRPEARRLSELT